MRGESETEVTPVSGSSPAKPSTARAANPPSFSPQTPKQIQETRVAGRTAKRRKEADSDNNYKPPIKLEKTKSKRTSSKRGSSWTKASNIKPNTSAFGIVTDDGGKCPKHLYEEKQEASDSDTSL